MEDRVPMFGIAFDRVTMDAALDRLEILASRTDGGLVVTANVDIVVKLQRDAAFREACRRSPLVLADGMPLVWASKLLGDPLPERVAGSDLFPLMCGRAATSGLCVYLLGARDGVADRAARTLEARYPGLVVAGTHAPPFGFDADERASAHAVELVRAARPDILFLGLGAPKQELWYERHREELGVPVAVGVGASFDFIAGTVRRAPRWMQRAGLEWFHRLVQEPRRMFRRYVVDDSRFVLMFLRERRTRR